MPPKKKTANQVDQGAVAAQGNIFSEGADPMILAIGVIDKKARNLEKRKVCLSVCVLLCKYAGKCAEVIVCLYIYH